MQPKIRFPEFADDWKERKLNRYLIVSTEKNKNNTFSKQDVLSVSGEFGIVNQIELQGRSFAGSSVEPYGVVDVGDVVYTKSPLNANPYGIIKVNKGKPGIVSTLYAVYKAKKGITDPDFVQSYFELDDRMNRYMKPLVNIGAKHDMKVSDANALTGLVVFPSLKEQQKITGFFKQIDNLIKIHQQKLIHLQSKKKSLLQKMFPKKGERVPEIRFPGFDGYWEQRKLGDLIDIQSGRDYKHLTNGDIPVYGTGGYMLNVNEALSYDNDAIGIGRKGTIDNPYILKAPFWTVDTLFYCLPKKDNDLNFIFDIFQNVNWKKYDESTGVPSLSKAAINKIEAMVTKYDEQQKIGDFFKNLDNLITLHQRKLTHLQTQKKALLQQMFV